MNLQELFESIPAYVDTKKNEPFNGYWLEIKKRSMCDIQYIVRYVCDTYSAEEITIPLFERVLHTTYSMNLSCALQEMKEFILNKGWIINCE